jgi:hypothetical protein
MRDRRSPRLRALTLAAVPILLGLGSPSTLADVEEKRTFDSKELTIRNLIGEVRVSGHSGSAFEVAIHVQGRDSTTPGVDIEAGASDLTIRFPEADRYVYPALGAGSRTTFGRDEDDRDWLSTLLGKGQVTVAGRGSGVEIWADLDVRVPHGGTLRLLHGVGEVDAANAKGTLDLQLRSGHVEARQVTGDLRVDTGSGHVRVADVDGALAVDTGSGHVEVAGARGPSVHIDTGSGHVEIEDATADRLHIDTGSGHVTARNVSAETAEIDTGSGGVTLELSHMGSGTFKIDTGSGGIALSVPRDASMSVDAETGSGGVAVDLDDDIDVERMERDEARFRLGAGEARVNLSTGSGGIRIRYIG